MRYRQTLLYSVDKWATIEAPPTRVLAICPQAKGFSKRNKLHYDVSKRVCRKYNSYRTGNQGHCLVVFGKISTKVNTFIWPLYSPLHFLIVSLIFLIVYLIVFTRLLTFLQILIYCSDVTHHRILLRSGSPRRKEVSHRHLFIVVSC